MIARIVRDKVKMRNIRSPKGYEMLSTRGRECGLEDYRFYLGFNIEDIKKARRILDLGSGKTEQLTEDIRRIGSYALVVSLNPDYWLQFARGYAMQRENWGRHSVAGTGQNLPLKDNSFDLILARGSLTVYADAFKHPERAALWIPEIVRVLSLNGVARLGPACGNAEDIEAMYRAYLPKETSNTALVVEPVVYPDGTPLLTVREPCLSVNRLVIAK